MPHLRDITQAGAEYAKAQAECALVAKIGEEFEVVNPIKVWGLWWPNILPKFEFGGEYLSKNELATLFASIEFLPERDFSVTKTATVKV